jgi:transcriptional regulator with XRE-family HTH domain
MNDRFIKLMQYYNLTPSLFADEIGVNRPGISHIISGRNKPGVELIQKVLKRFPEVSTDWLLMGNGSMFINPEKALAAKEQKVNLDLFTAIENPTSVAMKEEPEKSPNAEAKSTKNSSSNIKRITIYFADGSFKDFKEGD